MAPHNQQQPGSPNHEAQLDVAAIYAQNAQFLWSSLSRAGVADGDLPDALQEVLLVIHRRLDSFDGSSRLTTWLWGICVRVASTVRRSRRRRREEVIDPNQRAHHLVEANNPEEVALAGDRRRRLGEALDRLEPDKRAVLVMFELEGLSCQEIAELLGVPKGTVFSRLSSARQTFLLALERLERQDQQSAHALGVTR
ncbi:MAG TPA: sigma-70 family RNA polymerase sigma factor [Polyangiaceae bacterium]|nr:sigma-70 family RNA polymerase sigma factor [Polyangiaceae bacterium]